MLATASLGAQKLDDVLFSASQIVLEYRKSLAIVGATETFTQELVDSGGTVVRTRNLVSDYLIVHFPEQEVWLDYRDVLQVDGKTIRESSDRIARLFTEAPAGSIDQAAEQARKISQDGARQFIGEIPRTSSVPLMALVFLHPLNQYRFFFEKTSEETVDGIPAFVVTYTEQVRPTLLRGEADMFARGTVTLDRKTGRPLRTRLILGDYNSALRSTFDVTFKHDESIGTYVPVERSEQFDTPRRPDENRVVGRATYTSFRRYDLKSGDTRQSRRP
jgi:hypothetical protein